MPKWLCLYTVMDVLTDSATTMSLGKPHIRQGRQAKIPGIVTSVYLVDQSNGERTGENTS